VGVRDFETGETNDIVAKFMCDDLIKRTSYQQLEFYDGKVLVKNEAE